MVVLNHLNCWESYQIEKAWEYFACLLKKQIDRVWRYFNLVPSLRLRDLWGKTCDSGQNKKEKNNTATNP